MNWGYKIAIFYTAFALFMIALVVKSFQQEHDLVTDNYYEEELKFQQQIDKQNLVADEGKQVAWKQEGNSLLLDFPAGSAISGEIKLFRPSDASKDFSVDIQPDAEGKQQVDISKAAAGKYLLQIDWNEDGKAYFQENVIVL